MRQHGDEISQILTTTKFNNSHSIGTVDDGINSVLVPNENVS